MRPVPVGSRPDADLQFIAETGKSVIFDTLARILVGYFLRSEALNGIPDLSSKPLMQESMNVVDAVMKGNDQYTAFLQAESHRMLEHGFASCMR